MNEIEQKIKDIIVMQDIILFPVNVMYKAGE